MALAERRDCKDYVSVFVCSDWQLLRVRHPLPPGSEGALFSGEGLQEQCALGVQGVFSIA